jgi:hypothetical protein
MVRPQFLILLCALTLISCTLGLFESVTTLIDPAKATERIKNPDNDPSVVVPPSQRPDPMGSSGVSLPSAEESGGSAGSGPVQAITISDLVYNLLTLLGAGLMFFGRRLGWYVYVGGIGLRVVLPLVLAGSWLGLVSPGPFFSAIFAALYAYNWSYFR